MLFASLVKFIRAGAKAVLDLIYPKKCFSCGKDRVYFCDDCLKNLEEPPSLYIEWLDGLVVGGSVKNKALFKAIKFLKYRGGAEIASDLGRLLAQRAKEKIPFFGPNTILMPIPLFYKRERERGFNQAELLARAISGALKIPFKKDILERIKDTPAQAKTSSRKERFENIKNAFELKRDLSLWRPEVILVDDVLTTGATMSEAAKTLRKAGAKKIIGLVVAR